MEQRWNTGGIAIGISGRGGTIRAVKGVGCAVPPGVVGLVVCLVRLQVRLDWQTTISKVYCIWSGEGKCGRKLQMACGYGTVDRKA